ncbi:MAG: phage tail protein I [Lachnospiraceae bacterium]|nr:phage tail protein I [Lachnospiraceae bacterium]
MGMKIDNPKMLKLLPIWMRDDEANIALSSAMDDLIKAPGERVKAPRVWDQLEHLTDEELDETAWELGIDWWVSSWERDQKIRTIKMAGAIMEKRGTKWAVKQLAIAAFGMGEVTEWFEYGGEPFYFKILTNATLTPDGIAQILAMIARVKNARSHIETISVTRQIDQRLFAGCATQSHISNVILEGYTDQAFHNITVNSGTSAIQPWTRNTIH